MQNKDLSDVNFFRPACFVWFKTMAVGLFPIDHGGV